MSDALKITTHDALINQTSLALYGLGIFIERNFVGFWARQFVLPLMRDSLCSFEEAEKTRTDTVRSFFTSRLEEHRGGIACGDPCKHLFVITDAFVDRRKYSRHLGFICLQCEGKCLHSHFVPLVSVLKAGIWGWKWNCGIDAWDTQFAAELVQYTAWFESCLFH